MKKTMKKTDIAKIAGIIVSVIFTVIFLVIGSVKINSDFSDYSLYKVDSFTVSSENIDEEFEEKNKIDVEYKSTDGNYSFTKKIKAKDWEENPEKSLKGYIYKDSDGNSLIFTEEADEKTLISAQRSAKLTENTVYFGSAIAFFFLSIGIGIMLLDGKRFTPYEQIWFITILAAAAIVSVFFPEEQANGFSGVFIMYLYLSDTFLNILCELLISKQSKWNFIVSIFVELTEIAISIVLAYRVTTLATTLMFWLPIDIISFINWNRHPDDEDDELTVVRTLKGWQEVVVIISIIVWTVGIGYLATTIDMGTDFFNGNRNLEVAICYIDACASAVAMANGLFILLRLREQWIAWFIDAILEGLMNIITGQYVLLVLKVGYLTNSTYGYLKWTKYIKENDVKEEKFSIKQLRSSKKSK